MRTVRSDVERRRGTALSVGTDERLVNDGQTTWRVYRVRGGGEMASLVFDSERIVRRVREFHETWLTLADDDLLALSWKR